jgi:hypothetical protein
VTLNSHPCSHPAEGNSVWTERYNVYDRSDTFIGRTATLTEAAELIAQEVGHG